jgi:acyl-CoA dehydrogenase
MTEPAAGSDTRSIKMTAIKDRNEGVLSGEKTFITGGNDADFTMATAITKNLSILTRWENGDRQV